MATGTEHRTAQEQAWTQADGPPRPTPQPARPGAPSGSRSARPGRRTARTRGTNVGLGVCFVLAGLAASCIHVPPSNVVRDRFEYGESLSDSWKRQTLMNVVRLRYADAPVFLDISSVINTYSQSGTVNAGVEALESPDPSTLSVGGTRAWSNSPTVTYQPLSGDKFTRSLLHPIPPATLLQMVQAGWPVELIFPAALRSINGVRNQSGFAAGDPRFTELVDAMGRIQRSGLTGFRLEKQEGGDIAVMVISRKGAAALESDAARVREILALEPGIEEFQVVFGLVPRSDREVSMLTRSMLEIMLELAAGIDVPARHADEGRVAMGAGAVPDLRALIHVHSGTAAPEDAYAAVPYKGYWFWIDDRDLASKRLFTFLMILFSLSESGPPSAAPLVTIGAGK